MTSPAREAAKGELGGPILPNSEYTLTTADLVAYTNLVGMQCDIGAQTLTKAGLTDFIQRLSWCTWNYETITNAHLQQQLTTLYDGLAEAITDWRTTLPALLVAYEWAQFVNGPGWDDFYNQIENGITWQNRCRFGNFACGIPGAPQGWHDAIQDAVTNAPISPYPPTNLIWFPASAEEARDARYLIVSYELGLFDPAKWTSARWVSDYSLDLWLAQAADLATLRSINPLTDQMCLYLLYLLVGLCTSKDGLDLYHVDTIASRDATSIEYPNDSFIDQLTYYALMAWNDPKGPYQWTHDQLVTTLSALAVPNQDPASVLLQKTFSQQLAVLKSSTAYPMVDPYNPGIAFPQRKTDTLAALARAWAGIPVAEQPV